MNQHLCRRARPVRPTQPSCRNGKEAESVGARGTHRGIGLTQARMFATLRLARVNTGGGNAQLRLFAVGRSTVDDPEFLGVREKGWFTGRGCGVTKARSRGGHRGGDGGRGTEHSGRRHRARSLRGAELSRDRRRQGSRYAMHRPLLRLRLRKEERKRGGLLPCACFYSDRIEAGIGEGQLCRDRQRRRRPFTAGLTSLDQVMS